MDLKSEEACKKAAEVISKADIMLFTHGAGMSADSGLAVFNDIAKIEAYEKRKLNYINLCKPSLIENEPELFYGFWGKCFDDYRTVVPHQGYFHVKSWKEKYFSWKGQPWEEKLRSRFESKMERYAIKGISMDEIWPFFVLTSNIDAHCLQPGLFSKNELYEIHGNTEKWQCAEPCCRETWTLDKDFLFKVDISTMLHSEIPKCKHCGNNARPWVLMFADCAWNGYRSGENDTRYSVWSDLAAALANEEKLRVVILEVGAGTNVPSVRMESEGFLSMIDEGLCTLIRVNPDFPNSNSEKVSRNMISIKSKGLVALSKINEFLNFNDEKSP